MFVILPVEEHVPRFCLPFELFVVYVRLFWCLELVPVRVLTEAATGSADLEDWLAWFSCLLIALIIMRATSMKFEFVNLRKMACSSERWIKLAN